MAETGSPGQTGDTPVGIYVPTGTPKEIGEILQRRSSRSSPCRT